MAVAPAEQMAVAVAIAAKTVKPFPTRDIKCALFKGAFLTSEVIIVPHTNDHKKDDVPFWLLMFVGTTLMLAVLLAPVFCCLR